MSAKELFSVIKLTPNLYKTVFQIHLVHNGSGYRYADHEQIQNKVRVTTSRRIVILFGTVRK
jgi:hypothetical protein